MSYKPTDNSISWICLLVRKKESQAERLQTANRFLPLEEWIPALAVIPGDPAGSGSGGKGRRGAVTHFALDLLEEMVGRPGQFASAIMAGSTLVRAIHVTTT